MNPVLKYILARIGVTGLVCLAMTPALSRLPIVWWLFTAIISSSVLAHYALKQYRDEMAEHYARRLDDQR